MANRAKITKRVVDAAKPGSKDAMFWDPELKGFGLKVTPKGKKVYLVQYRVKSSGRLRKYTIGTHGSPWTPDGARDEAKSILGMVADGDDPADKKADAGVTIRTLCDEYLLHMEGRSKPKSIAAARKYIERFISPLLGKRIVADITHADIAYVHSKLKATPIQANRVRSLLSNLLTLAEVRGVRPLHTNPCRYVTPFKEKKHERSLSPDELGRLGTTLSDNEKHAGPYVVGAIRLLLFTGSRVGEILSLQWDWIDWDKAEALLPDSKTGAKTIHFPAPAMQVLSEIPRVEGNPHVIVGRNPGKALQNLRTPWLRIRKAAELEDVRLHDLRHAYASVAVSSGMGLPIIGKLLGHSQTQTTQRYAHLASDPVKAAAEKVAGIISDALEGKSSDNVVAMKPR